MGIFTGRSRSHTTNGVISNPTLTHTDALPRDDLRSLQELSANIPPSQRSGAASAMDTERPSTHYGQSQDQDSQTAKSEFDFQVAAPPAEAISSYNPDDNVVDPSMIGIALGSPGLVNSHALPAQSSTEVPSLNDVENTGNAALRRKPSKWKKIGNLFKAKTAVALPPSPPVYQAQSSGNSQPLQASDSVARSDAQSQPQHVVRRQKTLRKSAYRNENRTKGGWEHQESDHSNGYHRDNEDAEHQNWATRESKDEQVPKLNSNGPVPLLQVEIPDVQLERYSVMFSSVLGKHQQSQPSTLLARRDKALGNLMVPPPEPQTMPEDKQKPRRRATSPSATKSPAFSLFPPTPSDTQLKARGSHRRSGSSPLQRVQTVPAEFAREKESSDDREHASLLTRTPSLATSATSRSQSEWEGSHLSPETVNTSLDEDAHLARQNSAKTSSNPPAEPAWEMASGGTETPDAQRLSRESMPHTTPEEVTPMTPPNDWPICPPETASLNPSKEKVDRIMAPEETKPTTRPRTKSSPQSRGDRRSDISLEGVEVGIARSVSVSRGTRQHLVPVGARSGRAGKRSETPTLVDVRQGPRHGKS